VSPRDFHKFKIKTNLSPYLSKFERKRWYLSLDNLIGILKPRYCMVLSDYNNLCSLSGIG